MGSKHVKGETEEHLPDQQPINAVMEVMNKHSYEDLFELLPLAIYTIDRDGAITFYNKAAEKLWGREPIVGQDCWCGSLKVLDPEDRSVIPFQFFAIYRLIQSGQAEKSVEVLIQRPDGSERWAIANPIPIYDSNKNLEGAINVLVDITHRKYSEDMLRFSERALAESQRIAKIGSWQVDLQTDEVYWSAGIYRILGLSPGRTKPTLKNFQQSVHQDDREAFMKAVKHVTNTTDEHYLHHYRVVRPDGQVRMVKSEGEIIFDSSQNPVKTRGVIADITAEHEAREKLWKSEKALVESQRIAKVGSVAWDLINNSMTWSEEFYRILGFYPESVEPSLEKFLERVHPDDRHGFDKHFKEYLEVKDSYSYEYRIVTHKGSVRFVKSLGEVFRDTRGKAIRVRGVLQDITEFVEQKAQLDRLSMIAENTVNAVILRDATGFVLWVNAAFTKISGYSEAEVIGKNDSDLLIGPKTDQKVVEYRLSKIQKREPYHCELLKYTKAGKPFWMEIDGQPLYDRRGNFSCYFEIETDITERKKAFKLLERTKDQSRTFSRKVNQLLEAERAEIARDIHDEFGQQLSGIKMSLSTLQKIKFDPEISSELVKDLLTGINETTSTLRSFSARLRPIVLDSLGLSPAIEWLVNEFHSKTGILVQKTITCQDFISDEVAITFYRICQEALTNVSKHSEATQVEVRLSCSKKKLTLSVSDNGKGIDENLITDNFSMGLIGMTERAHLIEADFKLTSHKNKGTNIELSKTNYGEI